MPRPDWQNIPFAPRRCPFFYGWVIAAVSTIGIIASIPGQTMGVGVFTDDLIAVLKLDRFQLAAAYAVGTIASSLLLPFAGQLQDRVGTRVMVIASSFGLGISLVLFANCGRLAGAVDGGSIVPSMIVAFGCFLAIRFCGQGCLTVASRVAIGKWFNHRRGLATGISSVVVVFGFNLSPRILNDMVQAYGWQMTALVLAGLVGIGMTIIGAVFFRENPEACGLVMDGVSDEAWHKKMAAKVPDVHKEFTRGEAVRTWAFWAFSLGTATQSLLITAITFHVASLGEELGMSRDMSYAVFLPMTWFALVSNFFGGWLSDRIHLKWLLITMMVAEIVMTASLTRFNEPTARALFIVSGGIAGGLFNPLATVSWPRFFGRAHLGAISGLHMSIMVFASAIGPVLFAVGRKYTGSYRAVELACIALPAAILLCSFKVKNPQELLIDGAAA